MVTMMMFIRAHRKSSINTSLYFTLSGSKVEFIASNDRSKWGNPWKKSASQIFWYWIDVAPKAMIQMLEMLVTRSHQRSCILSRHFALMWPPAHFRFDVWQIKIWIQNPDLDQWKNANLTAKTTIKIYNHTHILKISQYKPDLCDMR